MIFKLKKSDYFNLSIGAKILKNLQLFSLFSYFKDGFKSLTILLIL